MKKVITCAVFLYTTLNLMGANPNDPIQFQDAATKKICLSHWDRNCDGELSYAEAAKVTDLGEAFKGSYIKRFCELEYFTGLKHINDYAFSSCWKLFKITIPNRTTSIGEQAFYGCSSLALITIPESVTSIGERAFCGCTGELTVNCDIPNARNVLHGAFYGSKFTKVTIGDSVGSIGDWAFACCSSLASIDIPNSVSRIGKGVFYNCPSLENITIPDMLTSIEDWTFYNCSSLTSIIIPNRVAKIGAFAISFCSDITSVMIPDNVSSIGDGAFRGCSSLAEFNGKFASEDGRCLIVNGVLNSFAPSGSKQYIIPDSVSSIGNSAFQFCETLTSVLIPKGVTSIGEKAFSDCSSLVIVGCKSTVPPNVNEDTFEGNAYERKIYVPNESVESYKSALYWDYYYYAGAIVGYNFE